MSNFNVPRQSTGLSLLPRCPFLLFLRSILLFSFALSYPSPARAAEFTSAWQGSRVWIGPEYWANPLQDWRVQDGEVSGLAAAERTLHLLPLQVDQPTGSFTSEVELRLDDGLPPFAWGGFAVGIQGALPDYRNALIFGAKKIECGVRADGRAFVADALSAEFLPAGRRDAISLKLSVSVQGASALAIIEAARGGHVVTARKEFPAAALRGNLALATGGNPAGEIQPLNKQGKKAAKAGGAKKASGKKAAKAGGAKAGGKRQAQPAVSGPARYVHFRDWRLSGPMLAAHPGQTFGPILWSQYTLSRRILKLTAQFPPLGPADAREARLEIQRNGTWQEIDRAAIHPLSRTATFRAEEWDDTRDTPYRVVYAWQGRDAYWPGTIRRDPVDKPSIAVAVFTGEYGYIFPQSRLTRKVAAQDPDFLFFSGDQIYEGVGGFGVMRNGPVEVCMLDYLRKYYEFGWQWRELLRDRPSVITPDDHDMFQGNIWGDGGKKLLSPKFEEGGYYMPPEWVNAVQATQTSHLPDPPDPAPIEQGIGVYFTDIVYGRISFAVVEDRKFKSPPRIVAERGLNARTAKDPRELDLPEAQYLGPRQEAFLRRWAADWAGADMKCVLSQTAYCKVTTHAGANCTPDAPPKPPTDRDLDSGAWPQSGRNRALDLVRRGFAFLVCGDQHNSAVVHLGIDDWEDAGVVAMTGSSAVGFQRAWWPDRPGENHQPGRAEWTGRYQDGLGNRMTVLAAGNMDRGPADSLAKLANPEALGQAKGSGHLLAKFNKTDRTITVEQWRLLSDPARPAPGDLFPDYPVTVSQLDCYGRKPAAWLPELEIKGTTNPVVQVVDETTSETVYSLRISGTCFRPKVFKPGRYTLRVGEPPVQKILKNLEATSATQPVLEVKF